MVEKLRIGVVFGGRSGEHEVSLVSGRSIMKALDRKKYLVTPVKISKDGSWKKGFDTLSTLKRKFDVMFPVLHGTYGEDGTIQGMFEMADVPYVGCGVEASSVAMDKFLSKMLFESYGLQQTIFVHVTREQISKERAAVEKMIVKKIGFPCFVKPANMGSSVGISKVKKTADLWAALRLAASYDASILIEKGIDAREIECAVLGNEEPEAAVPGEIVPCREFYDYYAKYVDNASEILIPAPISTAKIREVQSLAVQTYQALGASGMARVDFLMDKKTEKLSLNEVNTIPGFTSISMYPKMWEASGLPYAKLLDRLIQLAIQRHAEKQKNSFSFESGSDWHRE